MRCGVRPDRRHQCPAKGLPVRYSLVLNLNWLDQFSIRAASCQVWIDHCEVEQYDLYGSSSMTRRRIRKVVIPLLALAAAIAVCPTVVGSRNPVIFEDWLDIEPLAAGDSATVVVARDG